MSDVTEISKKRLAPDWGKPFLAILQPREHIQNIDTPSPVAHPVRPIRRQAHLNKRARIAQESTIGYVFTHIDVARTDLHIHIWRATRVAGIVKPPGDIHNAFAIPTFLMAKGDRARSQSRNGQAVCQQIDAMLLVLPISLSDRAMVPLSTRAGMRPKERDTREERGE